MSLEKYVEILLIEDSPGDIRLTEEAVQNASFKAKLNPVTNGIDAMLYLRKKDPFQDASRPDLILLDLNMPKKSGREVLAEIKNDSDLKSIPVIILTTSNSHEDIVKSYELNANSFITKPVELDDFFRAIQAIEEYWFSIAQLAKA